MKYELQTRRGGAAADRVIAHTRSSLTTSGRWTDEIADEDADVTGRWTTAHPCTEIDFASRQVQ
jgi:hypothetical protein